MKKFKTRWVEICYFAILLIIGLSLRLFRLGSESFSPLEASYIVALSKNFNNLLVYLITYKNISLCFSFAGFLWLKLFSYSEYSARLLSVLFGIGGILFCFKSLRFFYSLKISFFISFFLCCSPLYVQISRQFIPYAMLFFFLTLNIFIFCLIAKRGETKFLSWIYIISGLIAVNTHYICALIFIPQFYLLYNTRKKVFYRKKTWVVSVLIIVFITVLIFCIFENFSAKRLLLPIAQIDLRQLILSPILITEVKDNIDLSIMIFSVISIFFILYKFLKKFNWSEKLFFWDISFLVFLVPALIFIFFREKNCDGYVYLTCSVFIFYAVFFGNVFSLKNFVLKNLFVLIFAVFIIYSLAVYYNENSQPDFREAFKRLKINRLPDEKLLSFSSNASINMFGAYTVNNAEAYDSIVLYSDKSMGLIFDRINNNTIWVILTEKYEYKVLNELFSTYNFKLKKFFENQSNKNNFIGIYKYER